MLHVPIATYRVQFHSEFTLAQGAAIADYFASLGVSHLYASPYLQATPGSTHGYDIVDYHHVNDSLGGAVGHEKLCDALLENGLGQILDLVPNHMGVGSPKNIWWQDVLKNGASSRYAAYFDIDWHGVVKENHGKIPLPILGEPYHQILGNKEIRIEEKAGWFFFRYWEHLLPLNLTSATEVLKQAFSPSAVPETASLMNDFKDLADAPTNYRKGETASLTERLAGVLKSVPGARPNMDAMLRKINEDPPKLDALVRMQYYRPVFWQKADANMGYRRFFDISTLAGLRMENAQVFQDSHRLVIQWLREGRLQGLRVDHPDGLRDPEQYLNRLREVAPGAWIVVEKILQPEEKLPEEWPVAGTTGYDFLNLVNTLFVNPDNERALSGFYADFTSQTADYDTLEREKKHQVIYTLFVSELNRLVALMQQILDYHGACPGISPDEIRDALVEIIVCLSVYRTYINPERRFRSTADEQVLMDALQRAEKFRPDIPVRLLEFIRGLFLFKYRGKKVSEFILRFQQTTGPITAKGVEDTAFYCFNRFIALNEVGGDPGGFGVSVEKFHQKMDYAARHHPCGMLATSTHDTKRSEDIRARLALLSEISAHWIKAVSRWSDHNQKYRRADLPDRNTEYHIYQTLVGAWPMDVARLRQYMKKAVREAKVYTSWRYPDLQYEEAVQGFVTGIMEDGTFLEDLAAFVHPLITPGRINSLAQTLLKLTAPGVPDIYQGAEIWSHSLVDPDNRRPVDFGGRRRLLTAMKDMTPEAVWAKMDSGAPKLWLISRVLKMRRQHFGIFKNGDYTPVYARGSKADHVLGFLRGRQAATIVPRWVIGLNNDWEDTAISLPDGNWYNVLTDETAKGNGVLLKDLLDRFPVAALVRES